MMLDDIDDEGENNSDDVDDSHIHIYGYDAIMVIYMDKCDDDSHK